MTECEPCEKKHENILKMLGDLNRDLEKMLEETEKLSVQATWMAYDMVVMRTNPAISNSVRRLETAVLKCKEEVEKNWQDIQCESKKQ
ncbi:synaptonemal complex central element protein 3 [Protopterus annectens]|uniref:synaptonemal complex central element protein 3 n=1 Tax=Protopterus annectens TaxID=7888 RepID=UPI001CFAC425|nr:synaptonemal complex central element protein 3 [Protopterus annectens]XP_043940431.1 synaptonemal complex central element protein 3 [Protopterus annectens]